MKKSLFTLIVMGALMLAALVLLHLFPHIMGILVLLALVQTYRMLKPMINPGRPCHCDI